MDGATIELVAAVDLGRYGRVRFYRDARRVYVEGQKLSVLDGATPDDFAFLSTPADCLATSRGRVFCLERDITRDVDGPTLTLRRRFVAYSGAEAYDFVGFWSDRRSVYRVTGRGDFERLPALDPDDFEPFQVDDLTFFASAGRFFAADGKTAVRDDPRLAWRAEHPYSASRGMVRHHRTRVTGADLATFRVPLRECHDLALDAHHVYFAGTVVKGANPATFTFVPGCVGQSATGRGEHTPDTHFFTDGKTVWALESDELEVVPTRHPQSFELFLDPKGFVFGHDGERWFSGPHVLDAAPRGVRRAPRTATGGNTDVLNAISRFTPGAAALKKVVDARTFKRVAHVPFRDLHEVDALEYFVDARRVYVKHSPARAGSGGRLRVLPGARAGHLELCPALGPGFARSGRRLYFLAQDLTTLVNVGRLELLAAIPVDTGTYQSSFRLERHFRDGRRVYRATLVGDFEPIAGADPDDFEVFRVDARVYYRLGARFVRRSDGRVFSVDPRG